MGVFRGGPSLDRVDRRKPLPHKVWPVTAKSNIFALWFESLGRCLAWQPLFRMLASNQVVVVRKPGYNLHLGQDALHYVGIELPEP
jgi:hypothetical protein